MHLRIIPDKPENRNLLDMKCEGQFYFDRCLPLKASSSCHILENFSAALEFIGKKQSTSNIIHYVDYFFLLNKSKVESTEDLDLLLNVYETINVPIVHDKPVLSVQQIEFQGLVLDSNNGEIHLPIETNKNNALKL